MSEDARDVLAVTYDGTLAATPHTLAMDDFVRAMQEMRAAIRTLRAALSDQAVRRALECEALGLLGAAGRWYRRAADLTPETVTSADYMDERSVFVTRTNGARLILEAKADILMLAVAVCNDPENLVRADAMHERGEDHVRSWDTGAHRARIPADEWLRLLHVARTRGQPRLP